MSIKGWGYILVEVYLLQENFFFFSDPVCIDRVYWLVSDMWPLNTHQVAN